MKIFYTPQDIQTLLAASGITVLSENLNKDVTNTFDVYYRPDVGGHNFFRDLVEYFLIRKQQASNRRVAFLFEVDSILIIECAKFDARCAAFLLKSIQENALDSVDAILHSNLRVYFQQLYNQLTIHFVTLGGREALLQQLGTVLSRTYNVSMVMHLHTIEDKNPVMFIEQSHSLLQTGQLFLLDHFSSTLHQQVVLLQRYFAALHETNLASWLELTHEFEIILKYQLLQDERYLLLQAHSSSKELYTLVKKYYALKPIIFSWNFNKLKTFLNRLPLEFLITLLSRRDDAPQLLTELRTYKQQQYDESIDWEKSIDTKLNHYESHWGNWLGNRLQVAGQHLYHNSLMGLGSSLSGWIARHANPYIPWQSSVVQSGRSLIKTSVKLVTFFLTLSPRLANYAEDVTESLLSPENLPEVAEILGKQLGLMATTSLGGYYLLRMVMLSSGTEWIRDYLKSEKIDMTLARISSRETILPSLPNLMRINNTLIAAASALSIHDQRLMISALSGLGGSIAFDRIGSWVLNELKEEISVTEEDKHYIQFFLSLAGMEFANTLSQLYFNINDKLASREVFFKKFETLADQAPDVIDYEVTFPQYSISPLAWFCESETLVVLWRTQWAKYQAQCQLYPNSVPTMVTWTCEPSQQVYATPYLGIE